MNTLWVLRDTILKKTVWDSKVTTETDPLTSRPKHRHTHLQAHRHSISHATWGSQVVTSIAPCHDERDSPHALKHSATNSSSRSGHRGSRNLKIQSMKGGRVHKRQIRRLVRKAADVARGQDRISPQQPVKKPLHTRVEKIYEQLASSAVAISTKSVDKFGLYPHSRPIQTSQMAKHISWTFLWIKKPPNFFILEWEKLGYFLCFRSDNICSLAKWWPLVASGGL